MDRIQRRCLVIKSVTIEQLQLAERMQRYAESAAQIKLIGDSQLPADKGDSRRLPVDLMLI